VNHQAWSNTSNSKSLAGARLGVGWVTDKLSVTLTSSWVTEGRASDGKQGPRFWLQAIGLSEAHGATSAFDKRFWIGHFLLVTVEKFGPSTPQLYFLPLAVLAILMEARLYVRRFQTPYPWRESLTSLGVGLGHQLTGNINLFVIQGLMGSYVWAHRAFTMPDTWWSVVVLFLLLEFFYYWYHRSAHEVNVMWATHSTHHSPNEMTLTASVRLGWTPFLSFSWVFFLPMVWLGFSVNSVFYMLSISLLYQFWLHTRLIGKLGPLEGTLNTPSAHRVHHASNEKFLDKNYGGFLIVFDLLFGTYAEEGDESEIKYGLVHPNLSKNPFNVVFKSWRELVIKLATLQGLQNKTRVIFSKPGNVP